MSLAVETERRSVLARLLPWLWALYWLLSALFSVLQILPVLPLFVIADYPPLLLVWISFSLLTAVLSGVVLVLLWRQCWRSLALGLWLLLLLALGQLAWAYAMDAGYSINGLALLNPLMAVLSLGSLRWLKRPSKSASSL